MAVVIETTLGDITVDLYLEQRPVTCLNFLKLCKMKYYNFNLFHTIRNGFIAQTGDPTGEGSGGESIFGLLEGPEKRFFSGEKMPKIRHTNTGLLSMVGTGDMMVGSQFFLTLGTDLDSLDGVHCVIGEVTEGQEVLRKLNEAICDETHRPYQDVRITHTVVLEDPFSDPPGLRAPSRSPSPCPERLKGGRIAPDEELDETQGKSAAEIQEIIEEKEAKARATILEIVGDLPDADIAPPENVLFVCKLNPVTSDEDLEIIFSRFGKIESCEVIRDKKTGDSLQYAFIEFADKKSCEDAYFKMDNVLIDDRRIHVDFSQSVSKMRWLGKGRGVQHFDDDAVKDNSFMHKTKKPEYEERSKDRKNNRHDDRVKNYHKRHEEDNRHSDKKKYKNVYRERSGSKERNRERKKEKLEYERKNRIEDVKRSRNQRERSSSVEKLQYKNTDSKNVRKEKNYRERSNSFEKHAEKRQISREKDSERLNTAEAEKNDKHNKERKQEVRNKTNEDKKVRKSSSDRDDDDRKKDHRKGHEVKSKDNNVGSEKSRNERRRSISTERSRKERRSMSTERSRKERRSISTERSRKERRSISIERSRKERRSISTERSRKERKSILTEEYDKEVREQRDKGYERKSRLYNVNEERSNMKEPSSYKRQESVDEVHRNTDKKNNHHMNQNKSHSKNDHDKATSKKSGSSYDHPDDRTSYRDRVANKNDSKNYKGKDKLNEEQKGKKRQLTEAKHSNSKKQKKGAKEAGEQTPTPEQKKQKPKTKSSEKGKSNMKKYKSRNKKRKVSTSSESSSSESSSSSDSSSSSESDDRKKRSKRKRKYSSTSSSDTSDSSSSSSSSSDSSSSDSSSSSSDSEKNKRRKKNNKTKVIKKIKKN